MWSDQYIDIPYKLGGRDRTGLDCWGLVCLVYKEQFNIDLPSFDEQYAHDASNPKLFDEIIAREREGWIPAASIIPGTVLLFRVLGTESHVGVAISENQFIHIRSNINVTVESLDSPRWNKRLVGGFAYVPKAKQIMASGVPYAFKTQSVQLPIAPGTTVADVVNQIYTEYGVRQEFSKRVKVLVNTVVVPEHDYQNCVLQETDTLEFRVLPADEDIIKIGILFVIAIYAPEIAMKLAPDAAAVVQGGTAFGFSASQVAAASATLSAVSAGITMVGGMLLNALFPPQMPGMPEDPGQSQQQSMTFGSANEVRRYASIPVVLGKVRYSPPFGANPFTTFDDDGRNTYFTAMLLWGYGPLVIDTDTLKIGDASIDNYTVDAVSTVDYVSNSSTTLLDQIYSRDIEQQQTNTVLENVAKIGSVSISSPGSVKIGDNFANGTYPDVPLLGQAKSTGLTSNGSGATANLTYSNGQLVSVNIQSAGANYSVDDVLYPDYASFGGVVQTTTTQSTEEGYGGGYYVYSTEYLHSEIKVVSIDSASWSFSNFSTGEEVTEVKAAIHFPQGCRMIKVQGDNAGKSYKTDPDVQFQILYQEFSERLLSGEDNPTTNPAGWHGIFGSYGLLTYSGPEGGVKDAFTKTYKKIVAPGRYRLAVRRITSSESEPNDDWRYSWATTFLLSVFTQQGVAPINPPPNTQLARTAIRMLSSKELNGSLEAFNTEVQTYSKKFSTSSFQYSSSKITGVSSWSYGGTSNPADLMLYILQHPGNAERILDANLLAKVDLTALKSWSDYCDSYQTPDGTSAPLEYNAILSGKKSLLEVLREVCAAGRASPAMVDGKWTVNIDRPKTEIVQHFSTHNSWGFEAVRLLPRLPDGIKVRYYDASDGYLEKETIIYRADKTVQNSEVFESIALPGVTSTTLVEDHAMWHMAQAHYRREMYTLNTDIEYIVCNRGDRVKVTHDVPLWGLGSGRIQNIVGGVYDLTEDLRIDPSKNYNLRIRTNTGSSVVGTIRKSWTLNCTVSITGNLATVVFPQAMPLNVNDTVNILSTPEISGLKNILEVSVDKTTIKFSSDTRELLSNTYQVIVTLTEGFYQSVAFNDSVSGTAAGDLFLFGEVNTESQDLLVMGIEATSNNCARITLMDYAPDIYTNYRDKTNQDYVFNTNITLPQQGLINTFKASHIPLITNIAVDASSIYEVAPGVFGFTLKVSFANASNTNFALPQDTVGIQLQYAMNDSDDESTYVTETYDYSLGSVNITGFIIGETYKFRVRYVAKSGKVGLWSDWQTKTAAITGLPQDSIASLRVYRTTKFLSIDPTVDLLTNTVYNDEVKYFIVRVFKDAAREASVNIDFWDLPDNYYEMREFTTTGKLEVDLTTFTSPRMSTPGVHYLVACRAITKKGVISSPSVTSYYNLTTLRPKDA